MDSVPAICRASNNPTFFAPAFCPMLIKSEDSKINYARLIWPQLLLHAMLQLYPMVTNRLRHDVMGTA
jgi:hypothetical protein